MRTDEMFLSSYVKMVPANLLDGGGPKFRIAAEDIFAGQKQERSQPGLVSPSDASWGASAWLLCCSSLQLPIFAVMYDKHIINQEVKMSPCSLLKATSNSPEQEPMQGHNSWRHHLGHRDISSGHHQQPGVKQQKVHLGHAEQRGWLNCPHVFGEYVGRISTHSIYLMNTQGIFQLFRDSASAWCSWRPAGAPGHGVGHCSGWLC